MEQQFATSLLNELVEEERRLIQDLYALARREQQCCEGDQAELLPGIVAERTEVFQKLLAAQDRACQQAQLMAARGWEVSADTLRAAGEGAEVVRRIQALDGQSKYLLQKMLASRLASLRQMNEGSRYLRTCQTISVPIAHDTRA